MMHMKNYSNYTDNQKSWSCMKNIDLTGKYHVKVTFHGNDGMIPRSVRSFCL